MIEIYEESIDGVAVLHTVPAGKRLEPLPTVFCFHGFTSSKELYSYFAYALARVGFRVIMPEADLHGQRFNGDEKHRDQHFWDILKSNIDGLELLYQHYCQQGSILEQRVGVCGASLGGMTTLGAMARYPWIACAAAFMGSGYYLSLAQRLYPPMVVKNQTDQLEFDRRMAPLAEYEVSHQLEKIADRPLLIWHGLADEVVPASESAQLIHDLNVRDLLSNVEYLTEPGIGHKITVPALAACSAFFSKHL